MRQFHFKPTKLYIVRNAEALVYPYFRVKVSTHSGRQPFLFFFTLWLYFGHLQTQNSTSKPNVFFHHGKSHSNLCKSMVSTIIWISSNTPYDPSYTVNLQTSLRNNPVPLESRLPVQTAWWSTVSKQKTNVAWLQQQLSLALWRVISNKIIKWA